MNISGALTLAEWGKSKPPPKVYNEWGVDRIAKVWQWVKRKFLYHNLTDHYTIIIPQTKQKDICHKN